MTFLKVETVGQSRGCVPPREVRYLSAQYITVITPCKPEGTAEIHFATHPPLAVHVTPELISQLQKLGNFSVADGNLFTASPHDPVAVN